MQVKITMTFTVDNAVPENAFETSTDKLMDQISALAVAAKVQVEDPADSAVSVSNLAVKVETRDFI